MKMLAGNVTGAAVIVPQGFTTPPLGKALGPASLHMKVALVAKEFAKAPAKPLFKSKINVPLLNPLAAGRPLKALLKMGSAAWPQLIEVAGC
jgi:hypothetical protein